MKITILDDYQNVVKTLDCYKLIEHFSVQILNYTETNEDKLAALLHDTTILVLIRERTKITESLLQKLPNLKLISQTGKVSNHISLNVCAKYNVAVVEGVGSPIAPAELTWALLMNTIRKIPQDIASMKMGQWQTQLGTTVYGKTIGIWGFGKIGQKIAQYAQVFGATVMVWGSQESRLKAESLGYTSAKSKEEFFKTADVVTLHLRLNEATFGIVKQSDLELLKPNAALINTARAELIESHALKNVLNNRQDILVGIDVYEQEPILDSNHYLLKNPNVVCTPHIGYVEKDSYELYFEIAFENIINYLKD
jgi:D-3-phosphoglycerate dehydrogenase / 2-oxoglutarate reductase